MESYTFQDIYKPKIKTRQTSRQRISTTQIVALFVHTNQQYIEFSETTKWRDWIWIKTPRVTRSVPGQSWLQLLFSVSSVLLPKKFSNACYSPKNLLPQSKKAPPFFSFLSHVYIRLSLKLNLPKKKAKSPIFSLLFSLSFFKSSNSKAIFPTSNSPPKPSKESPTFLKLQW